MKFKYLWHFLTWPSRTYRRFEWWCISRFLQTKDIRRERVTLRLHDKYKQHPELQLLYYFRDLAITTEPEDKVSLRSFHSSVMINMFLAKAREYVVLIALRLYYLSPSNGVCQLKYCLQMSVFRNAPTLSCLNDKTSHLLNSFHDACLVFS